MTKKKTANKNRNSKIEVKKIKLKSENLTLEY